MTVYWAKPTLDEIAAQRAMLERREEKRKAAKQAEERERLRDTFAAAALAGLLADDGDRTEHAMPNFTARAYEWADAMLRERGQTNHDAVPEACAQQSTREPERSLLAQSESVERGLPRTGNTPSEAEIDALEFVVEEGRTASVDDYGILRSWLIRLRPEWESQSYEEIDKKRMNTNTNRDATPGEGSVQEEFTDTVFKTLVERISLTQSLLDENERLRRAIRRLADQDATLSVQGGNVTVTLDATLTDEERWAIHDAVKAVSKELDLMDGEESSTTATLRSLLERLA
jgi:uncharacterized protein YdaT